jgi:hypothetical protein
MDLDFKTVIFTNKETYEKVFSEYPSSHRRIYRIVELEDFVVSNYDWNKDYKKDHEQRVGHSSELYKIWAEKSFFLKRVIEDNPFDTDYFFWNDIGLFRFKILLGLLKEYPNTSKIEKGKVYMTIVKNFTDSEFKNLSVCDDRFRYTYRIAGGNFGGHVDAVKEFVELYSKTLEEFDRLDLFKGKDQGLYNWMIVRNPNLFKLVQNNTNPDMEWFYLYIYLK